ncbi:MAG: kinase [Arenimonas sp.]
MPTALAIAGAQGSGKSTLAAQLVAAGAHRGLAVIALSIDDFYLTRRERQRLAREVHALLATRGPPGTHDIALASATLAALEEGEARLPRFDKLADTRLPPSRWRQVLRRPDLIVFEGWFLGLRPQSDAQLRSAINTLERSEDPDAAWRRWCNARLADYAPLWQRFDRLLYLQAPSFDVVPGWRARQERNLAMKRSRPGMARAAIDRFVQHFERLTRHGMKTLPGIADRVVRLDATHRIVHDPMR